jgi:hypothetical protein
VSSSVRKLIEAGGNAKASSPNVPQSSGAGDEFVRAAT